MCAKNLERPHECPAVGMELGGGDVELGQQLPLEVSERKPKFHLLEQRGIDETEQLVVGSPGRQGSTVTLLSCSL